MTRRLLAEPLVHFLGIGVLLFLLYALVAPADTGGDRIVVSREMIASLAAQHERARGRQPSEAELGQLVDRWVADEIVYREGVAMGLDRDDAVIKRRVRQKYDLIAEEAASAVPTEADLEAYLAAHPERFREPPRVSFTQVVVPSEGDDVAVAARVGSMRAALEGGAPAEAVGQATLLPLRSKDVSVDRVAAEFGEGFAGALAPLPEGRWQGPVLSTYGLHLVRIDGRTAAESPRLAEVRAAVQREWENERRMRARDAREQELRARYEVVIEEEP
jgi:hypothetical protein